MTECPVCAETFQPAGLGGHITQSHSDDEVRAAAIEHLRDVAERLDRTPTRTEINELPGPSAGIYNNRFGGFNAALRAAGLTANREFNSPDSKQEFLEDVERVARKVERRPLTDDYREHGEYHVAQANYLFDGWLDALESADVPKPSRASEKPPAQLLSELEELGEEVDRPPTAKEAPHFKGVYARRWGSFTEALRAAGFDANVYRGPEFVPHGSNHPNWKPDSEMSQYGEGWTETKRQKVRERDGYECQKCGESQEKHLKNRGIKLHVHHIIPAGEADPENRNNPQNLITLCAPCHTKLEKGNQNIELKPPDS